MLGLHLKGVLMWSCNCQNLRRLLRYHQESRDMAPKAGWQQTTEGTVIHAAGVAGVPAESEARRERVDTECGHCGHGLPGATAGD